MTKTMRQILGEHVARKRQASGLSVTQLSRKSGTSRQSIYSIESGGLNVTADQFQKLLGACGVSPDQWDRGLDADTLEGQIPKRHQDLFHMLKVIVDSGDADLLLGIRVNLDAISDKALRVHPPREPVPTLKQEEGSLAAHEKKRPRRKAAG